MSALLEQERTLYERIWAVPGYADMSPGAAFVPQFLDMTQTTMRLSVLDAGCGSGKGGLALQAAGFDVTLCDLTAAGLVPAAQALPFQQACLWHDLKRIVGFKDWVYCADVMEHIPPALTMLVVSRLLDVARRGVFLSISTVPDQFGRTVGEPLHKTVESFVWWKKHLNCVGRVKEARDLMIAGLYLVERC